MSHSVLIMSREGRRRDSRNRCDCFLEKRTTHAVAKPDRSFQKPTHEAPGQSTSASLLPKMRGRGTGQTRGVTPREGGWHSCFPSPSSDGHQPQDPASGCRWLSWAESDQENSFYHKVMTRPLPAEGPGHGYCKLNKAFETPESCPLPQNESQDTLSPRFVWKGQKDSEKKKLQKSQRADPQITPQLGTWVAPIFSLLPCLKALSFGHHVFQKPSWKSHTGLLSRASTHNSTTAPFLVRMLLSPQSASPGLPRELWASCIRTSWQELAAHGAQGTD